MVKNAKDKSIQARHDLRRQKRIREQKIRRYTFFTVLGVIAILVVMFLTPLFNIKTVNIVGNNKISQEQIFTEIGDYNGRNLFSARGRGIKKKISKFAYTEKVTVKKKPFPPTLTIEVIERIPAVQVSYAETFIVIDKDGRILEKTAEKLEGVAVLEGVKVASANEGEFISLKEEETQKIVITCIGNMEKADIIKDVTYISFEDMTNITFNYQSRLDVICGTHIDFSRKLSLFKEAVNSNKLTQNSRGTINLATTGKAIYTP